jgi:hypothetical protein
MTNTYLRFGLWPENERSIIGGVFGFFNEITGEQATEEGVSVYHTKWHPDKKRWEIVDHGGYSSYYPSMAELIAQERDIYIVTGEISGDGTDGEPLIENVKMLHKITINDIYNEYLLGPEEIIETQDPPPPVDRKIIILHKEPNYPPEIKEIKIKASTNPESEASAEIEIFNKLIGSSDWEWVRIRNNVFMIYQDYPAKGPVNIVTDNGPIKGNIVIVKLLPQTSEELRKKVREAVKKLPWPWNEWFKYSYEEQVYDWGGFDFSSLSEKDIEDTNNLMSKWSKDKRRAFGQPVCLFQQTHFVMKYPEDPTSQGAKIFNLDECEKCGGAVMAVSSDRTISANKSALLYMGLQELEAMPPDIWYDEESGGAVCEDCTDSD